MPHFEPTSRAARKNSAGGLVFGALFFFAGSLLFLALGISSYRRASALEATGVHAQGTVVRLAPVQSRGRNGGSSTTYAPVVSYSNAAGAQVQFTNGESASPPDYVVGARVDVIYDPADPTQAAINSFSSMWLGAVAPGIAGGVMLLLSLVLGISGVRSSTKREPTV